MLHRSLAAKTLGVFIPLVLVAELVVFAFQAWNYYGDQREDLLAQSRNLLSVQRSALATALWEFDTDEIETLLDQIIKLPIVHAVAVFDESGGLIAAKGDYESPPADPQFRSTADIVFGDLTQMQKVGRLELTVHGTHIEAGLIEYAKFNGMILIALFIAVVGGTMISTRLFIGRPLGQLKSAIEAERDDGGRQRVKWRSSDELGLVVQSYNTMQERQETADRKIEEYRTHLEDLVEERTAEIRSSIEYASRIQRAILPSPSMLDRALGAHFVFWEPRDIVGGDMYWCRPWGDGHLVMLGDCTGHGVPGAFMTLIATAAFERADGEVDPGDTPALVSRMHRLMRVALGQHKAGSEADDGMELGACYLSAGRERMQFVGAAFDLYVVEDGDIRRVRGTRHGIGYPEIAADQVFAAHDLSIGAGQSFYLSSDGFPDQIGGEKTCMYGRRRFQRLLLDIDGLDFAARKDRLAAELADHQGSQPRRDDVSIIGFSG